MAGSDATNTLMRYQPAATDWNRREFKGRISMVLEDGIAFDRSDGDRPVEFKLRMLGPVDRPQVDVLQHEIANELGPNYIPAHPDAVSQMLEQGLSLGLFIGDNLEGLRLVYDQRPLTTRVQSALGLAPEMQAFSSQLAGVYVRKRFERNRLGFKMTELAVERLFSRGRQHIYSTVAPPNAASLRNLFDLGFAVRTLFRMDNGAERFLLHLQSDSRARRDDPAVQFVAASDTEGHQHCLDQRLIGTEIKFDGKVHVIGYRLLTRPS